MKSVLQEVCQTETYDLLYERYSLFSDAGAQVADMWGIPFMLEVNAPLIEERRRFEELPLAPLAETIERRVFQQADAILAVSRAVADHVMNRGANPDRVHIVPNAVDVTRFHPAVSGERVRSSLCPGATLLVGFVGSLKAWHGVDLLLPAFACASQQQWLLLIVGDGPERSRLESRADALGIRHKVVFTGAVPHSEVPEYIAALDIAVAPYDQFPNFYFSPLKLYEYLAMGKAVVASNIGQIADRVRHGDNGYLVPPEDEIALAEALRTLGNNDSLRAELGQRAPLHLQTWSQVANQTISICRQLRGEHARP